MKEYPKSKKFTITVTYGSDFQEEVQEEVMQQLLYGMKLAMESRHKKNKFERTELTRAPQNEEPYIITMRYDRKK